MIEFMNCEQFALLYWKEREREREREKKYICHGKTKNMSVVKHPGRRRLAFSYSEPFQYLHWRVNRKSDKVYLHSWDVYIHSKETCYTGHKKWEREWHAFMSRNIKSTVTWMRQGLH